MRIGIDARMLGPEQGGLGRYIEQLIIHLEPLLTNGELILFIQSKNANHFIPKTNKIKKVIVDIPWYSWREQIIFPKILAKHPVDLMHFPHWNIPLWYNKPYVVTVHDLLLLHHPTREASTLGPITYAIKNFAFLLTLKHAIFHAKKIISTSNYSKQDILDTFHIPNDSISVTYQGVSKLPEVQPQRPDKNFGITKPYALYVGVSFPHKNLLGLLRAWKIVEEQTNHAYQLVLAGKRNFFYNKLLNSAEWKACRNVIYTDFVTDFELQLLYKKANLYVMPSLYEGYALPALEAMQNGLPVISSNRTCLPEVLGDAAKYFDPENEQDIANQIVLTIANETIKTQLREAGFQLTSKLTGVALARATLNIYHQTVDNIPTRKLR